MTLLLVDVIEETGRVVQDVAVELAGGDECLYGVAVGRVDGY